MTLCGIAEPRLLVNPHNVIKATFDALIQLRNKAEVAALRGKAVEEL